jgi:hypothetical protein
VEGKGYKRMINLPDWQDMHKNIIKSKNRKIPGIFSVRRKLDNTTVTHQKSCLQLKKL